MNASAAAGRTTGRLLAISLPLAAAAGVGLLLGHLANEFVLDRAVVQLQASAEHTAWTWAASMATFAASLAAGLLGFLTRQRAPLALLGLLAFFALDDFIEIHERLGARVADLIGLPDWVGPRFWTLLYLPLLGLTVVLGWRLVRTLDAPVRRVVALGGALLAAGFVLEAGGIATKRLAEKGQPTPHEVRAGFEEAVELSGWILVAGGLSAAAVGAAYRLAALAGATRAGGVTETGTGSPTAAFPAVSSAKTHSR